MARRFVYANNQFLTVSGAAVVSAPFTVACLFRPASSSPAANGRLFSIGDVDVTNEQWSLGYNTLGRARWSAQTSAGEAFATYTGASMVAGQWYLLVGVEESATQRRIYLNTGTANNTTSRAPAGADTMRINAKVASAIADYGDGDIAVIGLWDGVILTATDVQRLTNGLPFERLYPHRLFLWRLEDDTADWRGRYPFVPGTPPTVVDGPPLLRRAFRLPVWKAPSGGPIVQGIGQVSETDIAQAISVLKVKAIAQVTETDAAHPITRLKVATVDPVEEQDTGQPISPLKALAVGQVEETDLAQEIGQLKTALIGQVTETDLAQPITIAGDMVVAVGQVAEVDMAQAISPLKALAVGQVEETDLAQEIGQLKTALIGQVIETDLAQPITWSPKIRIIGQVIETDIALPITAVTGVAIVGPITVDLTDTAVYAVVLMDTAMYEVELTDTHAHTVALADG